MKSCHFESILGTNPKKADTDGDQLSDFDEFTKVGTDPTKQDTNANGVLDGAEDLDQDGLNHLLEIKYGTNCFRKDTDGDGFLDGEEVSKYQTNPIVVDTDEDGLSDWEDVDLKFSPINPDTNGNGILDGKEVITQTCNQPIDTTRKAGITNVSVQLACDGAIDNRVTIMDTYNLDMKSSDVVGLIGVPVEISTDATFTSADITFFYDESALGETKEEDLCMMWYDEKNDNYILLEDSVLDKTKNTVTYKTTHFSTYLVVDKKIWFDTMRMDLGYETSGEVTYYDIGFVVDTSGSMLGSYGIQWAQKALNSFIDAMMEQDRAGLVTFSSYPTIRQPLTNDKSILKKKVEILAGSGYTNALAGIQKGIELLESGDASKQRMLILICDGGVYYSEEIVALAKKDNIVIHCINVVNGDSDGMKRIAKETGGNFFYLATSSGIENIIAELKGTTVDLIDIKDTDKDGLYDVYELKGMRMSNGKIVYTDPNQSDSNGDGISDYDAMGGKPVVEKYFFGTNQYACTLNHAKVYGKLSPEFIYVDGKMNSDGRRYPSKMDYIPYSNDFIHNKYDKWFKPEVLDENRATYGDAGVHKLYKDKWKHQYIYKYDYENVLIMILMSCATWDIDANSCFQDYITRGRGGHVDGWREGTTRKIIDVQKMFKKDSIRNGSITFNYVQNMTKAIVVAEDLLNEYNTEVYISVSPNVVWEGGSYLDTSQDDLKEKFKGGVASLDNIEAAGIFNSCDAGTTMHCTYNPETREYTIDYTYYIIDFYDFSFFDIIFEEDAYGLAKSYEIYGCYDGKYSWKKEMSHSFANEN